MKRIVPRKIQDTFFLAYILDQYLIALDTSPWQVRLNAVAYNTRIPVAVFQRLVNLQHDPEDAPNIQAADYHIVFSNLFCRYPTVKIWQQADGALFIEM